MTRDDINDTCNQANEHMPYPDCFSQIEYIDNDPESETDKEEEEDYCEDPSLKDRNNNSSEDCRIAMNCEPSANVASGTVNSYSNRNQHPLSRMSSQTPVLRNSRRDVFVPTMYDEEDRIEEDNSDLCSDDESLSSGDETEEENIADSNHAIPRHHTDVYNYNKNLNNNKKKSQIREAQTGSRTRSVNFRLSQQPRRQIQNKNRGRSVQLSSIRVMPSSKGKKPRSWVSSKVEYGQRLVEKNGSSNVQVTDFDRVDLFSRYFNDIFTTLLDSSWTTILAITAGVYVGHWLIFGFIYWAFAIVHGDYARIIPALNATGTAFTSGQIDVIDGEERNPCVFNVYDFKTAVLFSLESETTIGYGTRTITTECPEAVACLTLQCIISAIFDTWVIGLCFARLARPDARTKTTMFSEKAVICKRDGKRCLLVRFANLRKSLLLNVSVRARLITLRVAQTKEKTEGYQRMLEQRQVTFENESSALLTAPIEYRHVIDKDSPFYRIKPSMYNSPDGQNYFELIFIVTGTLESTGLTMHAQTSYLSSEILFGERFVPVTSKSPEQGRWIVDFRGFHKTVPEPRSVYKQNDSQNTGSSWIRDTSSPLLEETEDELLSTADDVFVCDAVTAPHVAAESIV